jgi:lipoate---protein ligase
MKILDFTADTPQANLALDEALVDALEEDGGEETLRFWESPTPFLVLGHGNRTATELQLEACHRLRIPILRRCSGGGTVLQGPGCFNFALALVIPESGPLAHITGTNRYVMNRHQAVFARLLDQPVAVQGDTDLALAECGNENVLIPLPPPVSPTERWLKFSGNAQRRKRRALLFHGSFLLDLDLDLLNQLLPHPSQEPAYRRQRAHADFLTNISLPASSIKQALTDCWQASEPLTEPPLNRMRQLMVEKYSRQAWNFKW